VKDLTFFENQKPNVKQFDSMQSIDLLRSESVKNNQGLWGAVVFDTIKPLDSTLTNEKELLIDSFNKLNYSLAVDFLATDTLISDDKYMKSGYTELQYTLQNALSKRIYVNCEMLLKFLTNTLVNTRLKLFENQNNPKFKLSIDLKPFPSPKGFKRNILVCGCDCFVVKQNLKSII
jgi:hypothetical protein